MQNILVVEDDYDLNQAICYCLKKSGYGVYGVTYMEKGKQIFIENQIDMVLLDVNLPVGEGFSFCRWVKEQKEVPVIYLTARDIEEDALIGYESGAEAYITKPFSMLILGKRITALLRRSENKTATNTIQLGTVTVDFAGYTAHDENGKIDITPKEIEILKVLIENKGLVLSRNQILDDVWGYDCDVIDRTIDAYIRNIRKKLHLDCITTVKGIGYKLEVEV